VNVIVAEKPSVARDLARVLGASQRNNGAISGNGWTITWAIGHLATLKKPDAYDPALKRWSLDRLPFVPERFELEPVPQNGAKEQLAIVADLCRRADKLWCATDAGREGELIFRYILEFAGCGDREFSRLWLSSLTDEAIRQGFKAAKPGAQYENLHAAARSRSEADWIVGLNATRAYTVRYGGGSVLWSLGRVQTPVLAMIAQRDDEIRVFDARPFWELRTTYRKAVFRHAGERSHDEAAGKALLAKVEGQPLQIVSIEKRTERIPPPLLYDLTQLQRDMNLRYGFSASRTLEIAQQLYEKKLLTYPRTDSRHLSLDMVDDVRKTLGELRAWNADAMRLLATWIQGAADGERGPKAKPARVFDNGKVSDHHAIIPTGRIERLDPDSQKVFDAVASRLVQAFLNDKVQELTSVRAVSNEVPFRARGTVIVEPGWSALEQPANADQAADGDGEPKKKKGKKQKGDDDDENQTLPAFTQGENGPHAPYLHEGKTKPPPAFTENTLLGAMETAGKLIDDESLRQAMKGRGLGTPATRASILETLISRSYVRRDKKALRVTDLGRYLIAIIQDPQLKSAELTGDWEFRLGEVERGARTRDDFMAGIRDAAHDLIEKNLAPRALPEGLGACPRCQAAVIEGRAAYGCSRWNDGCALRIPKDFQGFAIRPQHVRELVTRGIVLAPVTIGDQGQRILCATKNGEVFAIEPPSASAQGRGERSQGRGSARPGSAPRRAPSSQPDGEAKPKRRAAPKKKPRERGNEGNA
jgi:DNA topoisomerase-3